MLTTNYELKQRSKKESEVYMQSKVGSECSAILASVSEGKRRVRELFVTLAFFSAFANLVAAKNGSTFFIITLSPKNALKYFFTSVIIKEN